MTFHESSNPVDPLEVDPTRVEDDNNGYVDWPIAFKRKPGKISNWRITRCQFHQHFVTVFCTKKVLQLLCNAVFQIGELSRNKITKNYYRAFH